MELGNATMGADKSKICRVGSREEVVLQLTPKGSLGLAFLFLMDFSLFSLKAVS